MGSAGAAIAQDLPAVSAPNGKVEFNAGVLTLPAPAFVARAAGTLTLPVGSQFGIQIDVHAASAPGLSGSLAVHGFTRDPASYLIGGTLGIISTPGATVVAAGPEAELYFDRWTIEAWGGVTWAHPTAPGPDRIGPFVMGTLAYYPTDDLRLSLGLSSLDGYGAIHVGSEYQLEAFAHPVSVVTEARIGQDGAVLATLGLRSYFGGAPKLLIRRHREDDPVDRGTALYGAAGGGTVGIVRGNDRGQHLGRAGAAPWRQPHAGPSASPAHRRAGRHPPRSAPRGGSAVRGRQHLL